MNRTRDTVSPWLLVAFVWFVVFFVAVLRASAQSTCVSNGTPGLVRVRITVSGYTPTGGSWSGCGANALIITNGGNPNVPLAQIGEKGGEYFGKGLPFGPWTSGYGNLQGGGTIQVRFHSSLGVLEGSALVVLPSNPTKQIDYTLDVYVVRGFCGQPATVTVNSGAQVVDPCAPACTAGATRNPDNVSGWVISGNSSTYLNTWITREKCVGGSWVVETNSVWSVSGGSLYMVTLACRSGQWQVRQPITGYTRAGSQMNITLGPQEVNPKTCGQYAAESVGLVWTNLTTLQQAALDQGAPLGEFVVGVPDNPDGMWATNGTLTITSTMSNTLPAFVYTPSGAVASVSMSSNALPGGVVLSAGTGQSPSGAVRNVSTELTVGIGNLADLARAVTEGVYKGMTNASAASTNDNWTGPDIGGITNVPAYGLSTGFVGIVSGLQTQQVSATVTGLHLFASVGRLDSWNVGSFTLGAGTSFERTVNLTVDFKHGIGVGITIFRTAALVGLTIVFGAAAMRTIREGIA